MNILSLSARAAVTKYYKLGDSANTCLSQRCRLGRLKSECQADLALGEDTSRPVDGCLFAASSHSRETSLVFLPLFIRALIAL